ncbi:response regulator transcription factor [Paenibacillus faecalis]|uniref:response regulator transcription factor n=1 Tax=Paenibacillus faecalis TaxID=2079532 RepID=UPI000D0E5AD5|nr:response regulator transcription factor [Paenibacillus faecalis]
MIKSAKILIIDDDLDLGRLLTNCLKKENYLPTYVENGILGLEEIKKTIFDLVVLDIMLPKIDGFSVIKSIREISNIPVLMLTAKSEEGDKVMGLKLGADDYLTKPFGIDEFLARVGSIIRRANSYNQEPERGIIKYGNIELNSYQRTLKINREEIILTNKEFDLLHLLMSNKNKIFTKEQLYDQIWGVEEYDFYNEKNMVSFISKLRKKIFIHEKEYGGFIETVYGLGYRWRVK